MFICLYPRLALIAAVTPRAASAALPRYVAGVSLESISLWCSGISSSPPTKFSMSARPMVCRYRE